MNIVHLIFSLNTGGAETMLVDILNRQSLHNETHLVIVNTGVNDFLIEAINPNTKIHRINRRPGSGNPFPLLYLNLLMRKIGPDVVHMHNVDAIRMFPRWGFGSWYNCVTVHGLNKSCSNLHLYDKIFAISEAVKKDITERSYIKPIVVPNGVNFQKIRTKQPQTQTNDLFRIVQISRLVHSKKGQHLLIEAISKLKKRTVIKLEVTFIGEGESLHFLQDMAIQLGVNESCRFTGLWPRNRIYQELCEFDLLVQPSLYEGFGLTVIEGIAARIPVLVSEGGGPEEILGYGRYGWLFKNGDADALAEALGRILNERNASTVRNKLDDAYNYAVKNFSIGNTADTYVEEYCQN